MNSYCHISTNNQKEQLQKEKEYGYGGPQPQGLILKWKALELIIL